ncbi:MAG: ATP-binding protein [bacterium]|nr:ATP-binding protein [bacterium]
MRIAVSGSHRTGKSTLIAELAALLPGYSTVDEPYWLLEDDGHEFSNPPSIEDYEAQLARSIGELEDAGDDVLFDRCPLDMLAYIAVHDDNGSFDIRDWLPKVRAALQALDLLVLVPIEDRDRIALADSDDDDGGELRATVDEKLRELACDDPYGFGLPYVEVRGDLGSRAQAVLWGVRGESVP